MKLFFKRKAKWSDDNFVEVKNASRWGVFQLGLNKLDIDIIVRLVGPHPFEFGSCSMVDETRYVIWLHDNLPRKRFISTLFHELTHIKQHCYSGFELLSLNRAKWKQEYYVDFNYWNSPWEIEARKQERILYKRYQEVSCLR